MKSDCSVFLRDKLGRRDFRSVFAGEGEPERFRGSAGECIVVQVVGAKSAARRGIGEAGFEGRGGAVEVSVGGRVEGALSRGL